jgi:hypothetical protein
MKNELNLVKSMQKTISCISKKCAKERASIESKRAKYLTDLTKILQNKSIKNKTQKIQALNVKLYRCNERLKLVECQLQNCYKETDNMIKLSIAHSLQNPQSKMYNVAKKYQNIFKKGLTPKNVTEYDIAALKA